MAFLAEMPINCSGMMGISPSGKPHIPKYETHRLLPCCRSRYPRVQ